MENNNPFTDLILPDRYDFLVKLIFAAQHGYFGECAEIVNLAESNGLYTRVKPISANNADIKDLDNPIN